MLTDRDLSILRAAARYYVLSRAQVQQLCFPEDATGRATRRRLQTLLNAHLINRTAAPLFNAGGGSPWPAYFPARRGCELLAEHDGDERFLVVPTQSPQPHFLLHWLAVTETHLALDRAIALQPQIICDGWLNEWDAANPDESIPEKRYRLYTLLGDRPRLVCAPDAAFMLHVRGHRKVFYLEQDRNTSGVQRVAASKTLGYAAMAEQLLHRRHFPEATVDSFIVLMVAPTERRRDALRKAIASKPGASLWRFASATDLAPERLLFEPIFFPCSGDPVALVKASALADPANPQASTVS